MAMASFVAGLLMQLLLFWSMGAERTMAVTHNVPETFYAHTAIDIHGQDIEMGQYRGKVVLIINVASECGYTDSNYKWLSKLSKRYSKHGLAILLFPCNQFGRQEPGSNPEIANFIGRQDVNEAKMFEKVDVLGEDAHPLFSFLEHRTGHSAKWNFAKYLVDGSGDYVRFYSTTEQLETVEDMIRQLLSMHTNLSDL
eukprot:scpid40488/ scgid29040/ Probable phospholipid hydroperoxide glutathione peroxidase; 6P229